MGSFQNCNNHQDGAKRDAETLLFSMRLETEYCIRNPNTSVALRMAWYWSYIGAIDMARQMGAITDERWQWLYDEIRPLDPSQGQDGAQQTDTTVLVRALHRLKVETGSLACLGCGYENNCSTRGCAIIRKAIRALAPDNPPLTEGELQTMHGQAVYMGNGWACVVNAAERKIITVHGWYPFSALSVGMQFYRYPPGEDLPGWKYKDPED